MTAPAEWPQWEQMDYRLVSLWEIFMHLFKLNYVLAANESATALAVFIGNMDPAMLRRPINDLGAAPDEADGIAQVRKLTADMVPVLHEAGFDMSAAAAEALVQAIDANFNIGHVKEKIGTLHATLSEQFLSRVVLVVPKNKQELYEQKTPLFGKEVAARFSSDAAWEIEEAGKCLALGRATAAVFHLMRTMEVALEALRLCLQLQKPIKPQDKAWGTVLGNFETELKARNNPQHARQWQSQEDKEFFADLWVSLVAVKDAWRNKTMHVEKTYTGEQAEHVFVVVKGFMQKVASRLDEDGKPLA